MLHLNKEENRILVRLQYDLPLHERIFIQLADELKVPEKRLLETIQSLKDRGIIRNIAAIFNSYALGYHASLNAFQVAPSRYKRAIAAINAHPGVSHHYVRDHQYQLWFTLSLPEKQSLDAEVASLAAQVDVDDYLVLHTKKMLKARVLFPMDASFSSDNNDENASPYPISAVSLSKKEKEAVSVLLNDLPLTRSPFKDLCRKISSLSGNELLLIAQNLKLKKILKRYSAVLHHYNTAFICNALTAWRLDFQNMHRVRKAFNIGSMVSHLYIRDTIPGKWEYPLFAMIHAKNKEELADFINAIVRNTGCHDYLVLSTVKELKKERIHYFSE